MLEERAAATASYEHALRLDPDHATAHYNLGLLLQTANGKARAFEHFSLAYQLAHDLPDLLKNLTPSHPGYGPLEEALR